MISKGSGDLSLPDKTTLSGQSMLPFPIFSAYRHNEVSFLFFSIFFQSLLLISINKSFVSVKYSFSVLFLPTSYNYHAPTDYLFKSKDPNLSEVWELFI